MGLSETNGQRGTNISIYIPEALFSIIDKIEPRQRSKWICNAIKSQWLKEREVEPESSGVVRVQG